MKMQICVLILSLSLLVGCGNDAAPKFKVLGSSSATASSALFSLPQLANLSLRTIVGTPTSFKITLYQAYVSTSATCSNPTLLQDYGASGQQFDMMASPTLFSGSPADGTYPCLIFKFNDNMKFKADSTAVANHSGCANTTTEYTFDIYRDGSGSGDDGQWIDINGVGVDATGSAASPGADQVWVFSSTAPTTILANGVSSHVNQEATLSSALVVPGQTTYYWDATNGITNHSENSSFYCWIETVSSGFR